MNTINHLSSMMLTLPDSLKVQYTGHDGTMITNNLTSEMIDELISANLTLFVDDETVQLEENIDDEGNRIGLRVVDVNDDVVHWELIMLEGKLNSDEE